MTLATQLLRRTETGYLVTELLDAGHVMVRRSAGQDRSGPLTPPPTPALSDLPDDVEAVPARPDRGGLVFDVPGPASLAMLVLGGFSTTSAGRMAAPLGGLLARVHAVDPVPDGLQEPPGLARLAQWSERGEGPRHAARLHELVASMGALDVIRRLVDQLRRAPAVLALGAPGMSTLHPDPDGSKTSVLLTDEMSHIAGEWDLGWFVGEFLELENDPHLTSDPRNMGDHPTVVPVLRRYEQAGGRFSRELLGAAAALRWIVHLHDFSAYVGWQEDMAERLERWAYFAHDPSTVI